MTNMPTDFPTWYATVEAGEEGKAKARWAGVARAIAHPRVEEVEAFIRLALGSRQVPDQAVMNRIIENIRSGDVTFGTAAAARETQVLAAAALVARLPFSETVALALTTAYLDGARKPALPMDLFTMAENAVRTKAQTSRVRKKLELLKPISWEWSLTEEEIAEFEPQKMVEGLRNAVDAAIAAVVGSVNDILKDFEKAQEISDEELQMLWWLIGGEMPTGETFENLETNVRPFAVAHELARRTTRRPGPLGVPALLSRSGLTRQTEIKIVDAVNAMDDAWSKSTVATLPISPVTQPLHEAVRRRTETGAGENWVKNWSAVCEIDEGYALPALRLAELFYRERVLLTVGA